LPIKIVKLIKIVQTKPTVESS